MNEAETIQAIQRRMKEVRRELGCDLASSARDITDWRGYVRSSPWLCMAAAAAVGYLLVPKGTSVVRLSDVDLQRLIQEGPGVVAKGSQPGLAWRVGRTVLSNVGGLAMRGLLAYVGNRVANSKVREESPYEEDAPF